MRTLPTRRDLMAAASALGAAAFLGSVPALADEAPPEVTTLRLRRDSPGPGSICYAPQYMAEELLRA
jgi:hypothetical protein